MTKKRQPLGHLAAVFKFKYSLLQLCEVA